MRRRSTRSSSAPTTSAVARPATIAATNGSRARVDGVGHADVPLEPGLLQAQREERAEHHAIAEGAELQQVGEPDARIASRRGELRPRGCDCSGMAGARSLGVPRFRPANTTTADTRAQRGREPQRDAPGGERVDARVGQVFRHLPEQPAPAPPRPGPGRTPRARPAGRAILRRACRPAPSLTWCRWRRRPPRRTARNR